ncbi:MAG TPA: cytochrome c oxidase subunit 3 family protein [Terriglobales bacterium]|nr:cytochrome c oxidase subunit 3 family protein [Terriglobales bacterium]
MSDSSEALATHELRHHFENMEQQSGASSMGMWVFLITEIMFFGGMFMAYLAYRYEYFVAWQEGSQHMDFWIGTINTAVLICSSLTMVLAVLAIQQGRRRLTSIMLSATICFAIAFLVLKGVEYYGHWLAHEFPGSSFHFAGIDPRHVEMFFVLYFVMTGFHALHVLIGIGLVSTMLYMNERGHFSADYHNPVENVGLYWHFVDLVWIYLYPLLYLIGHHHVG